MTDPQERITIRPEDLPVSEPRPERITISPEELRAKPPPLPNQGESPIIAQLADGPIDPPLAPSGQTPLSTRPPPRQPQPDEQQGRLRPAERPNAAPQAARRNRGWLPVALFLGGGALIVAVVLAVVMYGAYRGSRITSRSPAQGDWIERIADQGRRSVVVIQAVSREAASGESPPEDAAGDEESEGSRGRDGGDEPKQRGVSLGSGFVVASDGNRHLILTNWHVLAGAVNCKVSTASGFSAEGRLAGLPKDNEIDLALVLVDSAWLQPLGPIGSFRAANPGEQVVAIGHPLGLDYTVTNGIISAKRGGLELQTSAPISPGNSGGPLLNRRGEVIGVNTRVVDPREGTSLGFAVRADYVLSPQAWNYTEPDVAGLVQRIRRAD